MKKKRLGRPPVDNPKSDRLGIRVTPEEKTEIMDFIKKHNIGLSDLLKKGMEAIKKGI